MRYPSRGYELYSWEAPKGVWNFSLLPSPSGVNLRAEDVFNKTVLVRGVSALNQRISKLPVGATIFWLDRILPETAPKTKKSERLTYPPTNIIEQVRRYADTRHVEVQVLRTEWDKGPVKTKLPPQ